MVTAETIRSQLDNCLEDACFGCWRDRCVSGKVRDIYLLGDKRILVTTDRQSAFDHVLGAIPLKGQVLNAISTWWFQQTADIAPNHILETPDPNCAVVRELEMLPVEIVVRAYLTGTTSTSIWVAYEQGERDFCGNCLPDGLSKNQRLEKPIITPTTKAHDGHDEKISHDEILARGLVDEATWDEVCDIALRLFARGAELAAERNLILVDTKYEMGVDADGQVVVADEVHTPDSSRFWVADSYEARFARGEEPENLDKEFLRLWLKERGISDDHVPELDDDIRVETALRYVDLYERVTDEPFVPQGLDAPVRDRIAANIAPYFDGQM